jgi:HAD superfamily hydrolase (TIGR01509 family)
MNPKIKLVMFDAAGVIWDGGYPFTCKYLSKKYNLPYEKVLEIMQDKWFLQACTGKMTSLDAWERGAKELGINLSGEELEDLHLGLHQVRKPLLDFADDLRKKGYICIILSNNFSKYINKFIKDFSLRKHFDEILNSQDLGFKKQDPRMFEYVFNKYDVTPEEIIYFDDQEQNLIVPKKMKINTFHFKNLKQLKIELKAHL